MKERPILFSAPMVRALLDGSKTQTRRVVKSQPTNGWEFENPPVFGRITSPHPKRGRFGAFIQRGLGTDFPETDLIPCPYGQSGDRLWVRETWCHKWDDMHGYLDEYWYRASTPDVDHADGDGKSPWKPSIHMPRAASRITLEITGVRVERLQAISEADAIAEGAQWAACGSPQEGSHKAGYAQLWESINGPGSWDKNPWVWVVEFKVAKL